MARRELEFCPLGRAPRQLPGAGAASFRQARHPGPLECAVDVGESAGGLFAGDRDVDTISLPVSRNNLDDSPKTDVPYPHGVGVDVYASTYCDPCSNNWWISYPLVRLRLHFTTPIP